MRLAAAAEQYARLLASRGENEDALEILRDFRNDIGPNPAIDVITARLEDGLPVKQRKLNARQGASLALYALGAAYAADTEADFASAYFELAIYINPEFDMARTLLSETLDKADRRQEAVVLLEGIAKDSPFYASSQGQLAWVLMRMAGVLMSVACTRTLLKSLGFG